MTAHLPRIAPVGLTGMLVTFGDRLEETANRAAIAFRAAVARAAWDGVEEVAASLASVFVAFDPLELAPEDLEARLTALLGARDWRAEPLPGGRRLWTIPAVFGGAHGPQWQEACDLAGRAPDQAIAEIEATRLRVMTIGFAPGQPYLGELPPAWNIPRQTEITPQVPAGAIVAAIRQLIMWTAPAPTGWRHIGQCGFTTFRQNQTDAIPLCQGDEVRFRAVSAETLDQLVRDDPLGGGAQIETIK